MLVNLISEILHPSLKAKMKENFPNDLNMENFLDSINGKAFISSQYEGIMYCGSLNPHLCTPPSYDLETYIRMISLSAPVDKRKFKKALGSQQSEFDLKPWNEIKDLPKEELVKLKTTLTNNYYLNGNGVCDNVEQVYNRFKWLADQKEEYCIFLTPMYKKDQPKSGGWRWEKWGEYIGTKNPRADYLYDEPRIDMVFVFSVCKIIRKELLHTAPCGTKLFKERNHWELESKDGLTLGNITPDTETGQYKVGYNANPFFQSSNDCIEYILKQLTPYLGSN